MPDTQMPDSRLTHIAFQVTSVERTVDFYRRFTTMDVVHERDDSRSGSKVIWLRHGARNEGMTIVLFEGSGTPTPGSPPAVNHLGFAMESRGEVDTLAARAAAEGILVLPPADHGAVVGYMCEIADPDGNVLEFSCGQAL